MSSIYEPIRALSLCHTFFSVHDKLSPPLFAKSSGNMLFPVIFNILSFCHKWGLGYYSKLPYDCKLSSIRSYKSVWMYNIDKRGYSLRYGWILGSFPRYLSYKQIMIKSSVILLFFVPYWVSFSISSISYDLSPLLSLSLNRQL